jgi:formylglycine-generating enzyme required for sulfatase activity
MTAKRALCLCAAFLAVLCLTGSACRKTSESDWVPVDAPYASLTGLAAGSEAAQERQRQAVKELGLPLEVRTRKTEIVMRLIPAGTFMMGSPSTEFGREDGETPHRVEITIPFYCGKFEITQKQWKQVWEWNPSFFKEGDANAPMEQVSSNECEGFLTRLCRMEGVPDGTYRLLTEAEWEYACRAGTASAYCFDDSNSVLGQYAWYSRNSRDQTHPVGLKSPNAFGLYDMHGNVSEWCEDRYGEYPYSDIANPVGPNSGQFRVYRGGNWAVDAGFCRSAYRSALHRSDGSRLDNLGLRIARSIPSRPR